MSGWLDSLFGNLPRPPARPTSRGATFGAGYQDMPTSTNIEDRRYSDAPHSYAPSRPHDNNWESTNDYNKFDPGSFSAKFEDQEANRRAAQQWARSNMPQTLSTQPLQDPNLSLDPSIMARMKAWQDEMYREYPPDWQGPVTPGDPRRPMPGDPPPPPPSMPNAPSTGRMGIQFSSQAMPGTSLNSVPWWLNGMGAAQ